MIRIRDDDVLVHSKKWPSELKRVQQLHRWMIEVPEHFIHVPTILVKDIQDFPEAVAFIEEETKEGRMLPEIHGLEHIDYGALSPSVIVDHLEQCLTWFHDTLDYTPTKFYTPWGAMDEDIQASSNSLGLTAVGVDVYWSLEKTTARLRKTTMPDEIQGEEIFMHWWSRGLRLKRLVMAVKYGSWKAAAQAEECKEFF